MSPREDTYSSMEYLDRLVEEARDREPQPMESRLRLAFGVMAIGFLAAAVVVHAVVHVHRDTSPWVIALLVLLYATLIRVNFEVGNLNTHPEQLAFIPLLFLAPPALLPLLVAAGFLLARSPDFVFRQTHPDRWITALVDSWPSIGSALLIGLLAP